MKRLILPFLADNLKKFVFVRFRSLFWHTCLVLLVNCKMTLVKPAASIYIWQRFYSAEYHLLCGVALTLWRIAYSAEHRLLCGVSLILCGASLTLQSIATFWTESAGFKLLSTACDSLKEIYNSPDDKDINSRCKGTAEICPVQCPIPQSLFTQSLYIVR